jgi:hypothetical protein
MRLSRFWQSLAGRREPGPASPAPSAGAPVHEVDWEPPFRDPELRRRLGFNRRLLRFGLKIVLLNLALAAALFGTYKGATALHAAALERRFERIGEYGRPPVPLLGADPVWYDRVRGAIDAEFDFGSSYSSDFVHEFQQTLGADHKTFATTPYRNLWTMLTHVNFEGQEKVEADALTLLSTKLSRTQLELNHYGLHNYLWEGYVVYIDDFVRLGRFTSARRMAARAAEHARRLDSAPSIVHSEAGDRAPWFVASQNLLILLDALLSESAAMYSDPVAARLIYHSVLELYPFAHQRLLQHRLGVAVRDRVRQQHPALVVLFDLDGGGDDWYEGRLTPGEIDAEALRIVDQGARRHGLRLVAALDDPPPALLRHASCAVPLAAGELQPDGLFADSLVNASSRIARQVASHAGSLAARCAGAVAEEQRPDPEEAEAMEDEASLDSALLADEAHLARLLEIADPRLQRLGQLVVAAVKMRQGDHDAALSLYRSAGGGPAGRVTNLALLGQARATFWKAHAGLQGDEPGRAQRRAVTAGATARLRELAPRLTDENFRSDLDYYLGELRKLAEPPAAGQTEGR